MKKIIALLSAFTMIASFVGCEDSEKNSLKIGGEKFKSGIVYTVGEDVEAGEYLVLADEYMETGDAIVLVSSMNPFEAEDSDYPFNGATIYSGNMHYNDYINVTDGQYIYLVKSHLESCDVEIDKELADTLKIGKDIPAGYYDFSGFRDVYVRDENDVILTCSTEEEKSNVHLTDGLYVYRYDNDYECINLD